MILSRVSWWDEAVGAADHTALESPSTLAKYAESAAVHQITSYVTPLLLNKIYFVFSKYFNLGNITSSDILCHSSSAQQNKTRSMYDTPFKNVPGASGVLLLLTWVCETKLGWLHDLYKVAAVVLVARSGSSSKFLGDSGEMG